MLTDEITKAVQTFLDSYNVNDGMLFDLFILEFEKPFIKEVLNQCNCNITRAARKLGITRATLSSKCKKYDIQLKRKLAA